MAIYGKFSISWTGGDNSDNRRKLQTWLDPLNTGTVTMGGSNAVYDIDLYIRDSETDDGTEPSNVEIMWNSPDIWIEDMNGNVIDNSHGNTEYKVCVRIHNKSDISSRGEERLFLNWAKAGIDLVWDNNWSGAF